MSRFKQYEEAEDMYILLEMMVFIESYDAVNEGIMSDIKNTLKSAFTVSGLHAKQTDGIIQQLLKSEKLVSSLMYHAFMSYYQYGHDQEKHEQEIKKLMKKIKKENLIDFLLRVDTLTMHLITGPIHTIDALTGTHIWADIKGKVKPAKVRAEKAINSLEDLKGHVEGKLKTQVQKYSNALRRVFNIGGHQKYTNEQTVGSDIASPDIKIGDKAEICPITGKPKKLKKLKKKKKNKQLRKYLSIPIDNE